jgi:hypothetical protein
MKNKMVIRVEISIGDLVDRVSILSIKREKIRNLQKRKHIEKEFKLLLKKMHRIGIIEDSTEFMKLRNVNLRLWDIENRIRMKESKEEFDNEFIQLARSVYRQNDERAELKRVINSTYQSTLVEEKEYTEYKR